MAKEEFKNLLIEKIKTVNQLSGYGNFGTYYAAYRFRNGLQEYFKFTAPKDKMGEPLGTEAVFLEMYAGGIYLNELNPLILLNYIIPFY